MIDILTAFDIKINVLVEPGNDFKNGSADNSSKRKKTYKTCDIDVVWLPAINGSSFGEVQCRCDTDAICEDPYHGPLRSVYDCCQPYGTETIINYDFKND